MLCVLFFRFGEVSANSGVAAVLRSDLLVNSPQPNPARNRDAVKQRTSSLHRTRRASRVNLRRNCLERRVPIDCQASGFAQEPFLAWHRAAPLLWLRLPKTCHRIRYCSQPFRFHAPAPAQTRSLLPAHQFGCRNAQVALRCAIASLAPASPRFVAQAPLHSASPNRVAGGV